VIETLRRPRNHPQQHRKEGDLIIGLNRSVIATLIDRTTRFAMLVHLPRQAGYGLVQPTKNGPALAGYGAITMKNALIKTFETLPADLRRSLTWDRGKEMSAHALLTQEIGLPVYFADAKSPWQRGSNEHLNIINNRPRGILGWRTPTEAFADQLNSVPQATVASTG
jgi:IS30 family transposase